MIDAFSAYASETLDLVLQAVNDATLDLGFAPLTGALVKLKNVSVDYAIMERATNLVAVPYASKWSDL